MSQSGYFLLWYDDDKKRSVAKKIADGVAAFAARFGAAPERVGVSPATLVGEIAGIEIYAADHIRPNCFYLGPLRSQKTDGLLKREEASR